MPATSRSLVASLVLSLIGACGAPPPSSMEPAPMTPSPAAQTPEMPGKSDPPEAESPEPDSPPEHARNAPEGCGLGIGDIALYQSVKALLVKDGVEVKKRTVDVVQRRQALVRVFLRATSGFTPGTVKASLILSGRDGKKSLMAESKLSGSSTDADLASTLNFDVPADLIDDRTTFAFELAAPSACASLRFPEQKMVSLGARRVGTLRIKLVPIRYAADGSNRMPDTGEEQLARIRARLQAMYPVETVELSVREPVKLGLTVTGAPASWDGLLDAMRDLRAEDHPDDSIYYFGLIAPAATVDAYCPGECYLGLSFRTDKAAPKYQVGVGIGFSGDLAASTMAHELGHMAGRKHAPCKVNTFIDPQYPQAQGKTGSWGWDVRTHALLAPDASDLMGYCSPAWISDYNYAAILDRLVDVASSGKGASTLALPTAARMLLVGGGEARWGLSTTESSDGNVEMATVRDEAGAEIASIEVRRLELGEGDRSMVIVPQPQPGWHSIEVSGAPAVRFDEPAAGSAFER